MAHDDHYDHTVRIQIGGDQSGTQKPPPRTPLADAEHFYEDGVKLSATGPDGVRAAHYLFEAAAVAALVSLAKTMDDLNGKLSLCGHGYAGAMCHLCMNQRR